MPIRILPPDRRDKTGRRGQFRTAKKYVPDVAKTAQHPHSKLKTQKELKKITDSGAYKKSDYKGKTAMLGGKSYAKGGKAGTGPSPGTRIKARKARAAEWWTGREGMQAVYNPTLDKKLREKRPHSSPEGRMRDVKTAYAKAAEEHKRRRAVPKMPKYAGRRPAASTKKFTPRTSKAVGGAAKIVPKITKRFLDFIKTGKHVDKHGVKVNVPKAAERLTGKPHVDHGKRKKIKHLGKGKAEGGRIGLKKGSVHKPGSHSWYLQHMTRPKRTKKAEGGRVNFRHGGSVGAAIKGHGAEIK